VDPDEPEEDSVVHPIQSHTEARIVAIQLEAISKDVSYSGKDERRNKYLRPVFITSVRP
jgi:hypothetical protein